jgi:hypothetical protein
MDYEQLVSEAGDAKRREATRDTFNTLIQVIN